MLAVVGARIYTSPAEEPIANGAVVITDGVITAVGQRDRVRVPEGATMVDGTGLTVTAGFWNTHVHFTEGRWQSAGSRPAAELTEGLRAMLTRWGVVRVVDTGSWLENTFALRRRIESGEIPGPQITIAGGGFVPVGGSPYYVLPARLPELANAGRAATLVERLLENPGVDAVKLFTGSWATRESIIVMPVDVVRAAVETAHARGKQVLSHPSNSAGARRARGRRGRPRPHVPDGRGLGPLLAPPNAGRQHGIDPHAEALALGAGATRRPACRDRAGAGQR